MLSIQYFIPVFLLLISLPLAGLFVWYIPLWIAQQVTRNNRPPNHSPQARSYRFSALIATLLGILLIGLPAWDWWLYDFGDEWYSTNAVVFSSQVTTNPTYHRRTFIHTGYAHFISYRYEIEVRGERYVGAHVAGQHTDVNTPAPPADFLAAYQPGSVVRAWYHRLLPGLSYGEPVRPFYNLLPMLIGAFIAFGAITSFIAATRRMIFDYRVPYKKPRLIYEHVEPGDHPYDR
jgi:hypothetical protein